MLSCGGGADESATTSSAESSLVDTSDILVEIFFNEIRFYHAVTDEELKVGARDALQVSADGVPLPLTEVQYRTCDYWGQHCRYIYHYEIDYPADIYGGYRQVLVEFIRNDGVSALNTVIHLPNLPVYSTPAPNSTFSIENDDIPISIYHAAYYSTYGFRIAALLNSETGVACMSRTYTLDSGQSDFIIPAGTLSDSFNCLSEVTESTIHIYASSRLTADPAFAQVHLHDSFRDSGISINLTP